MDSAFFLEEMSLCTGILCGIVQLTVSVSKKGFGPGTILGPKNEPEDWTWNETMQGSIIKVLCIGVSKFGDEFLLDS